MVFTWGGPDLKVQSAAIGDGNPSYGSPQPKLPGFDRFMMITFSPTCWAIPSNPHFDPKDAQGRQVLGEAAALQKAIYTKTGQEYLSWLRDAELSRMGMDRGTIEEYLRALCTLDTKEFQRFFKVGTLWAVIGSMGANSKSGAGAEKHEVICIYESSCGHVSNLGLAMHCGRSIRNAFNRRGLANYRFLDTLACVVVFFRPAIAYITVIIHPNSNHQYRHFDPCPIFSPLLQRIPIPRILGASDIPKPFANRFTQLTRRSYQNQATKTLVHLYLDASLLHHGQNSFFSAIYSSSFRPRFG